MHMHLATRPAVQTTRLQHSSAMRLFMRRTRLLALHVMALFVLLARPSNAAYDVIIVGSGPGGLVAAELLTRHAELSVLMLEAGAASMRASGGHDVPAYARASGLTRFDIPGEFDATIFNRSNEQYRVDWLTTPSPMWLGKMVGGCSSINAALYFRPPDAYVDQTQWPFSAEQVSSAFDEIETQVQVTDTPSSDGERYLQEAYEIVKDALESAGFSAASSLNDVGARNNKHRTFGRAPYAIRDGQRDAPAKTFLTALLDRDNFRLLTLAKVQHVQQSRGRATGVVYTRAGVNESLSESLTARGVVLLAAGALSTPALLMQSGIGPKAQLEQLAALDVGFGGVPAASDAWVVNENVGQRVFDAAGLYASLRHPKMKSFRFKSQPLGAIVQYSKDQSGPWATPGPVAIAYETIEINGYAYELQTTVLPHGFGAHYDVEDAYTMAFYLNNPQSRDFVSIDERGRVVAATNASWYGAHPDDAVVLALYADRMLGAATAAGSVSLDLKEDARTPATVADWVLKQLGKSVTHHFGGSCYTSQDEGDAQRCADEKFMVVGTSNVYLGDASLMQRGTVNPYAFVMYIGLQAGKNLLQHAFPEFAGETAAGESNHGSTATPESTKIPNSSSRIEIRRAMLSALAALAYLHRSA